MICSILIPSRFRFEKLLRSVKSFYVDTDPEEFDVVIRLHKSDRESIERQSELYAIHKNVTVMQGDDLTAKQTNATLWKELSALATGTWHQYWSDDMVISGPWLSELKRMNPSCVIAQPEIHQLNNSTYFRDEGGPAPFIPGTALKDVGCKTFPDPPDMGFYRLLHVNNRWPIVFLHGVKVWHDRQADKTLPEA